MSDVSFITSSPTLTLREPRTPEKPARAANLAPAPQPEVAQKTKVKTEQLGKYSFGYTFLDPETMQVVAQFPSAPPIGSYHK